MAVQVKQAHRHHSRGDVSMDEQKYDATYQFGSTTVHIVAPKTMTHEEKEKVLNELHYAGWSIVDELVKKGKEV
jgi:hypothetical protein